MSSLTPNQQKALNNSMKLGSWADEMNRNNAARAAAETSRRAALTPEQRAAENAAKVAAEAARAAVAAHPAVRVATFAAPMVRRALPPLAPRRPAPAAAAPAAWRPPAGKTMRECRNSNVGHAHASGAACKYVHKNENAYGHLRPNQKRPDGGKGSRKSSRKASRRDSRKASRRDSRKASRKSNRKSRRSGGGNIKIVPSPAPLSKVNTYTSWSGGIDPTVPLYNQRTMLGGKRSTRRNGNSSRRNNRR
jgi:hypothetical protein